MSDENPHPAGSASSRRSSANSPRSFTSSHPQTGFAPYPSAIRQTPVSIFTGLRSQEPSLPVHRTSSGQQDSMTSPDSVTSPSSIDRVFPVRSAVSIDPSRTPAPRSEASEPGFPGMNIGLSGELAQRRGVDHRRSKAAGVPSDRSSPPRRQKSPPTAHGRFRKNSKADSAEANQVDLPRRSSDSTSTSVANNPMEQMSNLLSDSASVRSDNNPSTADGAASVGSNLGSDRGSVHDLGLFTARFKHVITDGGHAVVTGRDGDTLQRCEDEPIHIPGAIQSFGLLIAFREEETKLVVRVVSENSQRIIGYTPAQLFRLDSFLDILTEEQSDNLLDHLDFIRDDDGADVVSNGPEVFMLSVRAPQRKTQKLWCAMHICESNRELVICEFELEDDKLNPLVPLGESTPELPADTLGSNPTPEELAISTENLSKPLRVLRSARKKRGEAAAMEVFNIMSQVQEQLASASTLQNFLRVLIGVVKELTGFHRVMVYQFDHTWNGRVVAELVDPRATKDLYHGLNFPASDIPKQARDLYKVNKVRLIYDRAQETARLVCRTLEDLENPLDMTHAYLRAMSPIHTKYLGNMGVRSSMSISVNAFGELWGLIACHTYGQHGMRVSFPIRKMCRLVGDTASRNIERLSYASRLQARKLINTTSTAINPSGYIVASSDDLLKLFDSDIGALSIREEIKILGKSQGHLQEVLAMVEFLRLRKMDHVYTSRDISADFPDLKYAPGLRFLAGLLYVPLSNQGADFIVFFRKGVLQEVKWAGNPYEKFVKEGTQGYLEPRKSFRLWTETIIGQCRSWTEEEIETAAVLCLVYGKFIDVWRQKEAALESSQLTKLLLANSAHEVRTPLNAIINYLEIALEGALDQDTRDNLAKSHSASKSLVYVINDLLDLTKTEDGQNLIKEERFDLRVMFKEATDPFVGDAKRKNIKYSVESSEDLPQFVVGDPRRVRQAISNLVANAIQHTPEGIVKVEAWRSDEQPSPGRVEIEIAVEDNGAGMSQAKVDLLFRELEEVSFDVDAGTILLEKDLLVDSTDKDGEPESPVKAALGLGLAVVARTIRNMDGQLRLKTEEGKGSRFVIQLGFDLDMVEDLNQAPEWRARPPLPRTASRDKPPTPSAEGEVLLIDRNIHPRSESAPLMRRESHESLQSMMSGKSQGSFRSNASHKSDVDKLIDAIQEPIGHTDRPISRKNSRESSHKPIFGGSIAGREDSLARTRAKNAVLMREPKSALASVPGQASVQDSGTPVKAVRLPEEAFQKSGKARTGPRVVFSDPERIEGANNKSSEKEQLSNASFSVLVAEDDPINSRIMKKRLETLGHSIHMTVNGEECSTAHGERSTSYDVILMDLQMPIVDGFTSTKMIRSFEKTRSATCLSSRAKFNGRIPIFAVSASLVERERERYMEIGFDGWILKPVDFKKVDLLLKGIVDEEARNNALYEPGKWELGGWFEKRSQAPEEVIYSADTVPSEQRPDLAMAEYTAVPPEPEAVPSETAGPPEEGV